MAHDDNTVEEATAADQEMFDEVYSAMEELCTDLEVKGIPLDYIDVCLLKLFGQRMSQNSTREEYDAMLQDSMDEEWDEWVSVH